jgi:hypothetical protein
LERGFRFAGRRYYRGIPAAGFGGPLPEDGQFARILAQQNC